MKTLEKFIQEMAGVTLSLSAMLPVLTPREVENNAQAYARHIATEAIKADREMASEITRIWQDEKYPNWETLREAILNRPIELNHEK